MKIGIHQHIFTSRLNEDSLTILDFIKELGFDSIDINLRNIGFDLARVIRKKSEKINLLITGGGSLPKGKEITSPEKQKRKETIEYMKENVRKVLEIGADLYHGVLYATAGIFTGKAPSEQEMEYSIAGIKEVANYARKYGVRLALEPANRYETYMLNTVEDALKMLKGIDEANVGLLLDTYHMNIEEKDMYKSIKSAGNNIFHFHVNENDRGIPGTGHVPWDDVFRALKDINYNKVAAVESFVDNSIDIGLTVAIWRKLAPSAEILARDSYRFIKEMSEKYSLR